jgi:hypothetical protein
MNLSLRTSHGLRLPLLAFVAGMALIVHHGWRASQQGLAEQEKQLRTVIDQTGAQLAGFVAGLFLGVTRPGFRGHHHPRRANRPCHEGALDRGASE